MLKKLFNNWIYQFTKLAMLEAQFMSYIVK